MNNNKNELCQHVFKSSTKLRVGIVCYFILVFFWGWLISKVIAQGTDILHFMLVFGIFLLIFLSGYFVIYGVLDLVVSDDGLSKCFFGKRIQYIKWQEVKLIRKFTVSDGTGNFSKIYDLCTDIEKRDHLGYSGKIVFRDDIHDLNVLIDLINQYIHKYQIKVEMRDSLMGEFTSTNQL